jgi:hypothetical protein
MINYANYGLRKKQVTVLSLTLAIRINHGYKHNEQNVFRKVLVMPKKTRITLFILTLVLSFVNGALAGGADPDQALTAALQAYAAKTGDDLKTFEPRQTALVDLNGDGIKDALVLLQGPFWYGTGGCTLLIFKGVKDGFKFVSSSSLIREPLLVSNARTRGWRDLVVDVSGGGLPAKKVALKFNGREYSPNPSVLPALPKNATCQGETVFQP